MEKRGGALIDIDREELAERMKAYFDRSLDGRVPRIAWALTEAAGRFDPASAVNAGRDRSSRDRSSATPCGRWRSVVLLHPGPPGVERAPPALWAQSRPGNAFL